VGSTHIECVTGFHLRVKWSECEAEHCQESMLRMHQSLPPLPYTPTCDSM